MVLVLTVLVLSILMVLGYAFSFSAGVNRRAAISARDALVRECAAESALNYAVAMLQADAERGDVDSLDERWAAPDLSVQVGAESYAIRITDEDGKLNVNRAVRAPEKPEKGPDLRPALRRLIQRAGGADTDFDAISAWLGRASALPLISALSAAPGVDARLFEQRADKPTLDCLLTTHSRHININTASEDVLDALWNDAGMTNAVLDRRAIEPFESSQDWERFLDGRGASEVVRSLSPDLDVKSEFFTIEVNCAAATRAENLTAFVRRREGKLDILRLRRGAKETNQ
ncbi:MAG: general secretion pathway protein GspK [Planctomycetes bacterium]|nr:general secretion pathway protein GspK [Planctomycetota bacterium]